MAFDITPAPRSRPQCANCPVQTCLARRQSCARSWCERVQLLPALMPEDSPLLRPGQSLTALYSVRAGCIKSYQLDADGNERIRGFHFPGDIVGLEALCSPGRANAAAAVTPSQVCAVALTDMNKQMQDDPGFVVELLQRTQQELRDALALSGEYTADERVAAFLLYLDARIGHDDLLRLPMTRREVGSYLRLATETVCRVLKRFQSRGWLRAQDKKIRLLNKAGLANTARNVDLAPALAAAA
ncbi:MAG: Crp/Fnr family transcriptional regulator [Panacagrimonas sp.]